MLHHFYKIVGNMARGVVLPLSSTLLDELLAAALLPPLAVTHMDDVASSELSATDATPSRGGRVRGHVPDGLALKLLRLAVQKGENCR